MGKHKLVLFSEEKLRKDARDEIRALVGSRFSKGKDTSLQDIQDVFQKPPYDLSEGTVINYLEELVVTRKLSTWKVKNRRFYGPPKIPLTLKIGMIVGGAIIAICFIFDAFISKKYIIQYIYFGSQSMMPIMIYLLVLTVVFTILWSATNRRLYK
jgi:hypothetical protein